MNNKTIRPERITELKIFACYNLCTTCKTCDRTPTISYHGDGYSAECICDNIEMMPWNAHPDQAMMSWNRCSIDNDWSLTAQRRSKENIAGKRATFIDHMFEGDKL